MAFSKSFPKTLKGSTYPIWEEITLTDQEESEQEQNCREQNIVLMKECIDDATKIFSEKEMEKDSEEIVEVAKSLFEKRASHAVYWKESKAKEKFDAKFKLS